MEGLRTALPPGRTRTRCLPGCGGVQVPGRGRSGLRLRAVPCKGGAVSAFVSGRRQGTRFNKTGSGGGLRSLPAPAHAGMPPIRHPGRLRRRMPDSAASGGRPLRFSDPLPGHHAARRRVQGTIPDICDGRYIQGRFGGAPGSGHAVRRVICPGMVPWPHGRGSGGEGRGRRARLALPGISWPSRTKDALWGRQGAGGAREAMGAMAFSMIFMVGLGAHPDPAMQFVEFATPAFITHCPHGRGSGGRQHPDPVRMRNAIPGRPFRPRDLDRNRHTYYPVAR